MALIGSTIRQRVEKAVQWCCSQGQIIGRDEFLWPANMQTPPVRRRDDEQDRDIDLISLDEVGQAAYMLLKAQMGMSRQDLVTQSARLLGFHMTGQRVAARIDKGIQMQIDAGRVLANGDADLKAEG